jgi:ribosomal protein L3
MTKLWLDSSFTSVTILEFPTQELKRIKTTETDGYVAAVVSTKNGNNDKLYEFRLDEGNVLGDASRAIDVSILENIDTVAFTGTTKGK